MTLLEMSFAGGVMILAVVLLRALLFQKLPKRILPVLWALVLCRLLIPFHWPEKLTVYSVPTEPLISVQRLTEGQPKQPMEFHYTAYLPQQAQPEAGESGLLQRISLWQALWAVGSVGLALHFAWQYRKARQVFREAVPMENQMAQQWLANHPLGRSIALRQIDRIDSPLTYGLLRPVILLPANRDWQQEQLQAALAHEWTHIRRWDGLTKLLLAVALCLHWWNPLVWLFYWLNNRDLELACDEGAIYLLGMPCRSNYARALVSLEQARQVPPLCSPFSRNPLETRIRAIVKMKKPTWQAWAAAALCLLAVTACFGSTAQGERQLTAEAPLTNVEREALSAMQYPNYEQMTVAEFRRQASAQIDSRGWDELVEKLWLDESMYSYQNSDREVEFLCRTLVPLTAGQWQSWDYSGGVSTSFPAPSENALLEYVLTLTITDEKAVTVSQYRQARAQTEAALQSLLQEKTKEQLRDESAMIAEIEEEINRLQKLYGGPGLELLVSYQYQPLTPEQDVLEDRQKQWKRVLAPYLPFGVTFQYDESVDSFRLYFQGEEVRGIYDLEQGIWITEHSGDGLYAPRAPELFAVYQDGKLTGLRRANQQEQQEFDQMRYKNAHDPQMEEELRQYSPGTEQDYQSLLALQTSDYRQKPLAQFNQQLLDWGNQDNDRYQRIMTDIGSQDFRVALTAQQKRFLQLTCDLSIEENFRQIQSAQRGKPALDPQYGGISLEKQQGQAIVDLWLDFTYHVDNPEKLTVGQRDDQVGGFLQDVQNFWDGQTLEGLSHYTRGQIVEKLNQLATQRSGNELNIQIQEDLIGFEMIKWTD